MDTIFTPPATDKVVNRGGREKVPAYLFIDPDEPSVLYIYSKNDIEIKDNSVYELNVPQINFNDNSTETKFKHTFITSPSPVYVDVDDVLKECRNIPIDKDIVIHSIKEASKIADYWAYHDMGDDAPKTDDDKLFNLDNIKEDYYPFYMFVKHQAIAESLKTFYIKAVSQPYKFKDILSDLERDEEMDLAAIKALIDDLEKDAEEWLELIVTITADPKWALRGKYSFAITSKIYRPYHPTLIDRTGWSRGY